MGGPVTAWIAGLVFAQSAGIGTSSTATSAPPLPSALASDEVPAGPLGAFAGRVLERGTRRPLEGAEIAIAGQLVFADEKGRFKVSEVPAGEHSATISALDHETASLVVSVHPRRTTELHVYLIKLRVTPYEVKVFGKAKVKEPVRYELDLGELTVTAGTLGDGLKAVQNLPGTARTALGLGGLIVRGSPAKDTKVFLDGHPIPMLYHLGGLTSVVNADTLERLDFVPGNFGARYGRGTGGVVTLESRAGKAAPHGYLDVDLLDVTFLAEANVAGGGLLLSGRRSWVDTFFDLIFAGLGDDLEAAPRTYDYQVRFERSLFGGTGGVFVHGADDLFSYVVGDVENHDRPTFDLHNAFHRAQLEWRRELGAGWSARVSSAGGVSIDRLAVGDAYVSDLLELELGARAEVRWRAAPHLTLESGLDLRLARIDYERVGPPPVGPDVIVVQPNPLPDLAQGSSFNDGGDTSENIRARTESDDVAPAAWLEATIDAGPVRVVPGARVDWHGLARRATFDPRVVALLFLGADTTLEAGAGLYSSPPDVRLLSPVFGGPSAPAGPELLPERALHTSFGVERRLPLDLTAEAGVFYKELYDLPVRTGDGGYESSGEGVAYGAELLLRRRAQVGLFGWIAYTLSRSERAVREDSPAQLFGFDQTHVLTVVASYRTASDWTFGLRVRYATGNPSTSVESRVFLADQGRYAPVFAEEADSRLPAFLQVDARIDKEWVFRDVIATAYVDVQNATNRTNAEGYQYNYNYTERRPLGGLPILPSAGVRLQF